MQGNEKMVSSDQIGAFEDLFRQLAEAFAKEGRVGGDLASAALSNADLRAHRRRISQSDPSAVLDVACRLTDSLPMSRLVQRCMPLLDWTSWEGEGLSKQVSRKLYTTELLGPDGHLPCENVRVGLLVSDVHTDYPISSHSGEETYMVISGTAEWTVGKAGYVPKRPGELIHHPAWTPHGRRTGEEPFLGAWRWSGDLDLSTFSVV